MRTQEFTNTIEIASKRILKAAKVNATVTVTPSTISFENIASLKHAQKLRKAFEAQDMKTLEIFDLEELGMGEGFELTVII